MKAFDLYGEAAKNLDNPIFISGRYAFQEDGTRQIFADVVSKLSPKPTDRLLEIGCGTGFILTPLSEKVAEAYGIDHPAVIEKYQKLGIPANVKLLGGEWSETKPEGTFDIIYAYGVLSCLLSENDADAFIDAATEIIRPNGRILLGDLPNLDMRKRFTESEFGKEFSRQWSEKRERTEAEHEGFNQIFSQASSEQGKYITDEYIFKLLQRLRKKGFESYLLPQPKNLPFSYSREDILIWKRD